ncbi:hypothetical protein Bca52824_075708 [Brassica carinata]|uniref:DEK-C domain-containing protein n=2 Tax=Brassica TaxID=3705 RepID=A0A8X7PQ44_BRACI|nr:hypothetical protein Bca52824_075708 [Brassica carinata]
MGEEDTKATVEPTATDTSSLEKSSEATEGKKEEEKAGGKETEEEPKKAEPDTMEIDAEKKKDEELEVKSNEDDAGTDKMEEDVTVTKDEGQAEATKMDEDANGQKEQTGDGVSGGGTVEDTVMKENVESGDGNNAKDDEKQESKEADQKKAGKESEEDVINEGDKANGTKDEKTGDINEKYKKVETVDENNKEQNKEEDLAEEGKEEEDKEIEKAKVEDEERSEDENDNEQVESQPAKEDEKEERNDDKEDEKAESGDDKEEEKDKSKGSKKRGKGKSSGEKVGKKTKNKEEKKDSEPKTPFSDRPVRERKSVERLVAVIDTDSSKEFRIEKGPGAYLKDIPSVAYKVTRKKSDETLKLLHTILFGGRRGKAPQVKTNILSFSGFVWHGNEEKAKEKIKEKFDKCIKDKLVEFCEMFDIHVTKATTKEDIVTKLFEFLEKPHAKGDAPASEKEKSSKGAKRKRTPKKSSPAAATSSSKRSAKSQRKSEEGTKAAKKGLALSEDESEEEKEEEKQEKEQKSAEEEENVNGIPDKSEDEAPQPSESEEKAESEEERSEEETPKKKKKRGSKLSAEKKESAGRARNKKASVAAKSSPPEKVTQKRSSSKRKKTDNDSDISPKVPSKRKKSERVTKASTSTPSKSASKEKPEVKGAGKGKEKTKGPSDKVLKNAIIKILKRVDFNIATFTDIIKELGKEFKDDLTPRKLSIKMLIQSELTKLAGEAEEEKIEEKEEDAEKKKAGGSAGTEKEKEEDAEKEKAGASAGSVKEKEEETVKEKAGGSAGSEKEKEEEAVKEKAGGSAGSEKEKEEEAVKEKAGGSADGEETVIWQMINRGCNPFLFYIVQFSQYPSSGSRGSQCPVNMSGHHGEEAEAEHMEDDDTLGADFENLMCSADTTASQAPNRKDIQGIPWDKLSLTREEYRKSRLQSYRNYENIPNSGEASGKDCLDSEKGSSFYRFKKNFRSVTPTILHFQLRELVWATSNHDVYLMCNNSITHWSTLTSSRDEVLDLAGLVTPSEEHPGSLLEGFSKTHVSSLAVKDGMVVAGGFSGELICKHLDRPGVSFCYRLASEENAITNSVNIHRNSSGALHFMASSNDGGVRNFDMETYQLVQHFHYPWPVNHSSVSPDGKLVTIVGDDPDGLLVDSNNGETVGRLYGHLDYSFASAWHPDGVTFATGNQDKTCRVWDVRNLSKSVAILKGNLGAIRSIKFTSDGQYMAMAEAADFVHIYNTNTGYMKEQEIDFFGEISGISFSPDTESLFIGVYDRSYGSLMEFARERVSGSAL